MRTVLSPPKIVESLIAPEGELTSGRPGLSTIFQLRSAALYFVPVPRYGQLFFYRCLQVCSSDNDDCGEM